MASCAKWHKELDENGEGKCSVPMWNNGLPAGFCDKTAYGKRGDGSFFDDSSPVYKGYVPYLACPGHGGPKSKKEESKAEQEALKPDKEKLEEFAEMLRNLELPIPVLSTKEAKIILEEAFGSMNSIADRITHEIAKL